LFFVLKGILTMNLSDVEFHSLYWSNVDPNMVKSHEKVMNYFEIPINYYPENVRHGEWMDDVVINSNSKYVVFFDIDCVPLNTKIIEDCVQFLEEYNTLCGIAQVSNHIPPKTHIYSAPAFFGIDVDMYVNSKSEFLETRRSDVCEELCYELEEKGMTYKALYPTHYYNPPKEGLWRLNNYGYYGIGTIFENSIFHLYQSRFSENAKLFDDVCKSIVKGKRIDFECFNKATF